MHRSQNCQPDRIGHNGRQHTDSTPGRHTHHHSGTRYRFVDRRPRHRLVCRPDTLVQSLNRNAGIDRSRITQLRFAVTISEAFDAPTYRPTRHRVGGVPRIPGSWPDHMRRSDCCYKWHFQLGSHRQIDSHTSRPLGQLDTMGHPHRIHRCCRRHTPDSHLNTLTIDRITIIVILTCRA